jgi:predicted phage-related endonuclease
MTDERWLQWRREGVTATEVADAMAGTYGGIYGVVAKKQGRYEVEQTPQMARGHRWEPILASATNVLTGLHVVGEQTWCENRSDPRWRCTIDGFLSPIPEATVADCIGDFEAKTVGVGTHPNRSRWRYQVQWQMLVTEMPMALIAEAVIDDERDRCVEVRFEEVEADPLVQRDLVEAAEDIWAHMQNGTLPEPSDASALEVVRAVYAVADADAPVVDLAGVADSVTTYKEVDARIKELEKDRDVIRARIEDAMGEATKGTAEGWRVSLSLPAKKLTTARETELLETHPEYGTVVLDRARVKAEAPDLYESFQSREGARRLTVTAPKS